MSEHRIEHDINDALDGDAQKNALEFIAFLQANNMQFMRGAGRIGAAL